MVITGPIVELFIVALNKYKEVFNNCAQVKVSVFASTIKEDPDVNEKVKKKNYKGFGKLLPFKLK